MLARIWNHLPENIKAIENVKLFTQKLKLLLLDKMFYGMRMNISYANLMRIDQ